MSDQGALANRQLDDQARGAWNFSLGRNPTREELEAIVRFARIVEGLTRNAAQRAGLDAVEQARERRLLGARDPEPAHADELELLGDCLRAFGRFAPDPVESAFRSRRARRRKPRRSKP